MSVYRTAAEVEAVEEIPDPPRWDVHPFQRTDYPTCPKCVMGYARDVSICHGARTWWSKRPTCPQTVEHFHLRCVRCHAVWLMATNDGKPGTYE